MDHISILTTQNVNLETSGAGIGKRFLALIIDYLVIIAIDIGATLLIENTNIVNPWITMTILSIIFFFYHFFFELATDGQSLGKIALKIRVVKISGESATGGQYFIRALFRPVDMFMGVGLLVMIFNDRNQRLGDLVAGTMVVKVEKAIDLQETILSSLEENYEPLLTRSQIERIQSHHIELMKKILHEAKTKKKYHNLKKLYPQVLKLTGLELSDLPDNMSPMDFVERTIADYNYYA